ncbi:DNA-processing protein DprA [uncultured Traorella sp.]|uniref:DNA-processing protein DprA n=1 Tax=uncultured Traorella sp. TaxID=1929048 RepID=UPI0025E5E235|nr:DNA-processing protein DprA [uncultured Traorella sp.]
MREQILYYALKYRGEYASMHRAIMRDETWKKVRCDQQYLTILDEEYPKELFLLEYPPYILFYEGDLTLLKYPKVCVIGSRNCSGYAHNGCHELIRSLDAHTVIVSGMAKGVDALAHQSALKLNYRTIGVIGCGLDKSYPKENAWLYEKMKSSQLLLSEYPSGTLPLAHHFPWRNRILAALGEKCYVVEARNKSGTMITADYAQSLNKEVIAFPYRFDDDFGMGCNCLIEQGAGIFMKER